MYEPFDEPVHGLWINRAKGVGESSGKQNLGSRRWKKKKGERWFDDRFDSLEWTVVPTLVEKLIGYRLYRYGLPIFLRCSVTSGFFIISLDILSTNETWIIIDGTIASFLSFFFFCPEELIFLELNNNIGCSKVVLLLSRIYLIFSYEQKYLLNEHDVSITL